MRPGFLTAFGEFVNDARGRRTFDALAQETQISRATLSRIERGYPPDVVTIIKMHLVFGTAYETLMELYCRDFYKEGTEIQELQGGCVQEMQEVSTQELAYASA